ncbi:HPP family protein [Chloroflexota bacterium]
MEIIDKSFKRSPKSFIIQSLLAVVAVAVILYFVEILTHAAVIAALGSSAFIVFAMPHSITARSRKLIGGHIIGLASGTICYYAFLSGPLGNLINNWEFTTLFIYALAVGLAIFLMVVTNTEHPPAAGTALGIVVYPWSSQVAIFVLSFAIILAIVRRLLISRMKDLV